MGTCGDLNLKATELRLGLPGTDESEDHQSVSCTTTRTVKRSLSVASDKCSGTGKSDSENSAEPETISPPAKTQIVGWPPVRSFRKNILQEKKTEAEASGIYVKVSMDGAPYLRKIDLKMYSGYAELFRALENMFKFTIGKYSESEGYKGSEFVPTYEDKDGDWMLVGDVPWEMFMSSCKRLRIMKATEARGIGFGV